MKERMTEQDLFKFANRKNKCVKEKCRFYDDIVEYAIDCCTFGASIEDEETERGCKSG